ncbi:MAG: hypothetical protein QGH51_02455 [Planctomycetota bacterium]|nr:hypothetical protein [Planctomycetota bacterium]MDP6940865.1 hypothetical protein [Planctomycetota bacterium]
MRKLLRYRAASAYANEVTNHLGHLTLQASILAGMRLNDGYRFCPAPALIPPSPHTLWEELQSTWAEYGSLLKELNQYFLEGSGVLVRSIELEECAPKHHDDLRLALVAASLLSGNVHAHCVLSSAFLRSGRPRTAQSVLWEFSQRGFVGGPRSRSRLLRNMAAVADSLGDVDESVHYARLSVEEAPEDPLARATLREALAQREVHA